jgi:hypothetical protein
MSGLREAFDEIAADVPVYGDLDRAIEQANREQRRRYGLIAGLTATAAAVSVIAGALVFTGGNDAKEPVGPIGPTPTQAPTPTPTPSDTTAPETVPDGPSEVLAARQTGRFRVEVGGEVLPGRWALAESRGDVWAGAYFDDVGYSSTALWWGKGTTTHEVVGWVGGVAISQDARWIAWTRATEGGYDASPNSPRVIEVVDTATGDVRWSGDAEAVAPDIGALAVTNDGVVVYGRCIDTVAGTGEWLQCDGTSIDAWAPRSGVTSTVSTERPELLVTGAHNGFLVRDTRRGYTPRVRPKYVTLSATGEVDVVATLPRNALAVTADERFALLATECPEAGSLVCEWSVLPLDGGEPRPIPGLSELVTIAVGYDWPVDPFIVEHDDQLILRSLGGEGPFYPPVVRCSLEQAQCVRLHD